MTSLSVRDLDARHPYWNEHAAFWKLAGLLHKGGYALQQNAEMFLVPRPSEPRHMFDARLKRFSYQNILGTALGWYVSRLFAAEPQFYFPAAAEEYLRRFTADADRRGTSLVNLARQWFLKAVLNGGAYVLIDLPNQPLAANFREQKASGALDAFLVSFDASQVINWATDAYGNFEWVVIRTAGVNASFAGKRATVDRWYYFDRTTYRIWESAQPAGADAAAADKRLAQLVGEGRHALADQNRVPLRHIGVPEELWLAYRVMPQVVDHLNVDNALSWGLFMGNVAMPIIIADDLEDSLKVSEASWLHLPKGSEFFYSEPTGSTFAISAERIRDLRQEIYRQMYLQAQGRDASATAAAASGYSKEMDMAPASDVLNGYGAIFRAALQGILADAALIRGLDPAGIEVRGLTFDDDELTTIEAGAAALDVDIPSSTYRRHIQKAMARRLTRNASPETIAAIDAEIDAAPSAAERQAHQFSASLLKQFES